MALVKYGPVITDSRGAVGGVTFKYTKAGSVMQTKSNPTTRLTQKTAQKRNNLATVSAAWSQDLSTAQRQAWRTLAAANPVPNQWGDLFPISGPSFFIRTNLTLLAIGEAMIDDAPADQSVTALGSLTLTVTTPNVASLAFTPTPTTADHKLLVAAAAHAQPGRDAEALHYTFLLYGAVNQTSPLNLATAWNAAVGNFQVGQRYAVRAVQVNAENGARSNEIIATTLAT